MFAQIRCFSKNCPAACGFKLMKQQKDDVTLAHKSWVHCPVWSINGTKLTREERRLYFRCHCRTIGSSLDRPTVSTLPIPKEEDKTGIERQIELNVKERLRQSFPTRVRERIRDLFPHSDSNSAQRSNAHSHPSHRFTGWKSPGCTKSPNLILSLWRRRRVPWPILIREVPLCEKP